MPTLTARTPSASETTQDATRSSRTPAPVDSSPRVSQLRALQEGLSRSPRVQRMTQLKAALNPSAAAPIQRMRWRKQGPDIHPEDRSYLGAPDVREGRIIPTDWLDNDVWDDANGNVYNGTTGFLRYNHRLGIGNDAMLPGDFQAELTKLNDHPDLATKKKADSYRVKLNALRSKILKWLETLDSDARLADGTQEAADRALVRIDALRANTLYPQAPYAPKTRGERASLALGGASSRLYDSVAPAVLTEPGTMDLSQIDSRVSDEPTGTTTVPTHTLAPQDDGLRWWASAAMGLRETASKASQAALLHMNVGSGRVPIGVRPPDPHHPGGEFIVLGHEAPIVQDTNPEVQGLRTPSSAEPRHRVSYPAFLARLEVVKLAAHVEDPQLAKAMLEMVRNPGTDPADVDVTVLPLLRELLVTWMVAEPARHRSVIFNSVLALREVSSGRASFQDMLTDDGAHPMTGAGTAGAGRTAEKTEAAMVLGGTAGDLMKSSKVVRKQTEQLARTSGDGNLSSPLEDVLRSHGVGGMNLRPLPQ
ncbi:hypothetical protein [Myxococcus qinghaiensis]|uniref:hypothetical protein n=1 Tax=Myxococcus qinghaiensis TaxID=2906758 RepID=UPI0020A74CB3|nr:hypothetical protein [Myxococcus qinghaiensis]MCP3169470.1 hypothetical protein [Myxococcus qinghaiensis]